MKRTRFFVLACVLLAANSAYLFVTDRLPFPSRSLAEASAYVANALGHIFLGLFVSITLLYLANALLREARKTGSVGSVLAVVTVISLVFEIITGAYLVLVGNHIAQRSFLGMHITSSICLVVCGLLYLFRWIQKAADSRDATWAGRVAAIAALVILIPTAGGLAYIRWGTVKERGVSNPSWAPPTMFYEGGGQWGAFWPNSVTSVNNAFFPASYFMDSEACGKVGCHSEIFKQWSSSAHHFSSFNNQWYRKSIEYLQEMKGTKPSKWCGGCHDMAVLLTSQDAPNSGKSLMDVPIYRQDWPPSQYPKSHAGIGCAVCHSIVHVKSTMGNGDYLADYPPMHRFVDAKNPILKRIYDYILKVAPSPHDKTFLKPFHTDPQDVAKFCSTCHKVHLDVPVNSYRWFRGFDDYDSWQSSGVSGLGAASFYYPSDPKTGQPAFKNCTDCHMPQVRANDPAAVNGMVHSHRFIAANTALPWVNHDTVQLQAEEKFLEDGQVSVDLFALRRTRGEFPRTGTPSGAARGRPSVEEPQQAANLMESSAPTSLAPASGTLNEDVVAPLNRGAVAVRRGETVLVDAVVRTRKLGHGFPAGTNDAFDVWLQVEAVDNQGRRIFSSGDLEYPDGPIDKWAHRYGTLLIDLHGNPINKRNASSARYRVYAHVIPPGAADTVHYEIHIPDQCGPRIFLTCKLNYRKFSWYNNAWSYAGRPLMPGHPGYGLDGRLSDIGAAYQKGTGVTPDYDDRKWLFDAMTDRVSGLVKSIPTLPIVTMAASKVTLNVVDGDAKAATAPRKLDPKMDMTRWNDYAIGFLLQGDSLRATAAFKKASEILPKSPEPLVNLGRIRLLEGGLDEAKSYFERAIAMYDANPTPMTPYQKGRTLNFYAQVLKEMGLYDESLAAAKSAMEIFPKDRNLRNLAGRIYFLEHDFKDAEAQYAVTLDIDPEDITANYNMMLVYRGLGEIDNSKRREALYLRFKADELNDHLGGPYKLSHPWDNIESESVHTHTDRPYGGKGKV